MKMNTLFKIQSIVALVVFTLGVEAEAQVAAPTACSKASDNYLRTKSEADKKVYQEICAIENGTVPANSCEDAVKTIKSAEALRQTVAKRFSQAYVDRCLDGIQDNGKALDEDEEGDGYIDEETVRTGCENFRVSCSMMDSSSSKDLVQSAQEKYTDAQKEYVEAQQNAAKSQKGFQRMMTSIEENKKKLEREYQLKVAAIQKGLEDQMKGADKELRTQVQNLRNQITATRDAVIAAEKSVADAELAVVSAKADKLGKCRTEADQAKKIKEAEIKKKNEENKTKKVNHSSVNIVGATKRKDTREKLKVQEAYVVSYSECINGVGGSGPGLDTAITVAESSLKTAKDFAAKEIAKIMEQANNLKADYADAQTTIAAAKDSFQKAAQLELATASAAYQNQMEAMSRAYAEAQQDLQESIQMGQQSIQIAMQSSQAAQAALNNAQMTEQCGGGSVSGSKNNTKLISDYDESIVDRAKACTLVDQCSSLANSCKEPSESKAPTKPKAPSSGKSVEGKS